MGKTLTAAQVEQLPNGTIIEKIKDDYERKRDLIVAPGYQRKILLGLSEDVFEIKDEYGWHYELPEEEP